MEVLEGVLEGVRLGDVEVRLLLGLVGDVIVGSLVIRGQVNEVVVLVALGDVFGPIGVVRNLGLGGLIELRLNLYLLLEVHLELWFSVHRVVLLRVLLG